MKNRTPPGPRNLSLGISAARQMKTNLMGYVRGLHREYGDIVYLRLGPYRDYLLFHPDQVREVLVTHARSFEKMPHIRRTLAQLDGNGLVTSEGEYWQRQRRLVQGAFGGKRFAGYGQTMTRLTLAMLDRWRLSHPAGAVFDFDQAMTVLTLQIAAKTLFNHEVEGSASQLLRASAILSQIFVEEMSSIWIPPDWLPLPSKRRKRWAIRFLDKTVWGIIRTWKQQQQDQGDLLSMLMLARDEETSGGMTDEQVRDEVMTLLMAGHDTTASGLTWVLYLLARHPEIAAEARAEIAGAVGNRPPEYADLVRLPLLDCILKESLRLYSPAVGVLTRIATSDVEIGGYRLARGSLVQIFSFVPHYDSRWWDEPERFDPGRFAEGRQQQRPQFSWFPFGGGPRVCIGQAFSMMEMALVVATLLQHLEISLPEGHRAPEAVPRMSLRPRGGLPLAFRWRDTN